VRQSTVEGKNENQVDTSKPPTVAIAKSSGDQQALDPPIRYLQTLTGIKQYELARNLVRQLCGHYLVPGNCDGSDKSVTLAVQTLTELAPQNLTEARLAIQMTGVHEAANNFLRRAMAADQPSQFVDANVLRATRLMRLFVEQAELMQRLRGKTGLQRVVVEHVNVHEGGRAIVGVVGGKLNDK
jgi:hypothetical protein